MWPVIRFQFSFVVCRVKFQSLKNAFVVTSNESARFAFIHHTYVQLTYTIVYIYIYICIYTTKERERQLKSKAAIENLESIDPERKKRARKTIERAFCVRRNKLELNLLRHIWLQFERLIPHT